MLFLLGSETFKYAMKAPLVKGKAKRDTIVSSLMVENDNNTLVLDDIKNTNFTLRNLDINTFLKLLKDSSDTKNFTIRLVF